MNINDAFPSNYLKASDLKGDEFKLTISKIVKEPLQDGTLKPVLYFQKAEKGLIVNKTNGLTIASYYGPETDGWVGKELILYSVKVPFQGQLTDAIRVRAPGKPARTQQHSENPAEGLDDEIPF